MRMARWLGVALIAGLLGWWAWPRSQTPKAGAGVVVISPASSPLAPSPPPVSIKGPAAVPSVAATPAPKRFGEPATGEDVLLDPLLQRAPDEIGVRHRLLAMQWKASPDAAAQEAWRGRLFAALGSNAGPIRVRCSATTCELAAQDKAALPGLIALSRDRKTGPGADPCLADETLAWPGFGDGGGAVVYAPRRAC